MTTQQVVDSASLRALFEQEVPYDSTRRTNSSHVTWMKSNVLLDFIAAGLHDDPREYTWLQGLKYDAAMVMDCDASSLFVLEGLQEVLLVLRDDLSSEQRERACTLGFKL